MGKRLDYIACGRDFYHDHFLSCSTWSRAGRRLQVAHTLRNWDHWPMIADFFVDEVAIRRPNHNSHLLMWNKDKLRHGLQHGESRQELLIKMEEHIDKARTEIEDAFDNDATPDRLDKLAIEVLRDASLPFFCNSNNDTKDIEKCAEKTVIIHNDVNC